ncbi:MAG: helix-turn-helix transcriptional regulator [Clostridiales bacterium]|nr:helix-turn-helix transcriptional regulator [Clostridiales bacterium]
MIKIKVSDMLGKYKMTRKELSKLTGIRPNTIGALYNETVKRIDIDSLDKMCKVFNCELYEIIEYVPDEAVCEKNNMLNLKIAEKRGEYKTDKDNSLVKEENME